MEPEIRHRRTEKYARSAAFRLVAAASILIMIFAGIVNIWGLDHYPAPTCDEMRPVSFAYSFVEDGQYGWTLVTPRGENTGISGHPYLYYVLLSGFLWLTGPTLFAARLLSFLGSLATILLTGYVGKRLWNETVGITAALVLSISTTFFFMSHFIRPETWVAVGVMMLIILLLRAQDNPTHFNFVLLGFALVWVFFGTYLSSILFVLPTGILAVLLNVKTGQGRTRLLFLGLGVFIGASLYLLTYLPQPFLAIKTVISGLTAATTSLCGNATCSPSTQQGILETALSLLTDLGRIFRYLYADGLSRFNLIWGVYFAAGLVYALVKREKSDRLVLGLWFLSTGLLTVVTYKSPHHAAIWVPLEALFIASFVVRIADVIRQRFHQRFVASEVLAFVLVLPLVGVNLAGQVWLSYRYSERDLDAYLDQVAALVPEGRYVTGDPMLWFLFYNRNPYVADLMIQATLVYSERDGIQAEVAEQMQELGIEYVVDDGAIACSNASPSYTALLEDVCTVVGGFEDRWFGVDGQIGAGGRTTVYDCTGVWR